MVSYLFFSICIPAVDILIYEVIVVWECDIYSSVIEEVTRKCHIAEISIFSYK